MCVAILSDIHGNLEALEAVLERLSAEGAADVVCLGDVVGYGADPNACADLIRGAAAPVLAGNHDWAAVGLEDPHYFNPAALAAVRWTERELTAQNADWLRKRPLEDRMGEAHLFHASPHRPRAWSYIAGPAEGRWALAHTPARLCFVGHSHHAFACAERPEDEVVGEGRLELAPGERYLVNAGSVGQPRDGDARAAFALWDPDGEEVRLCRVAYDLQKAQRKIRGAGLPDMLAERLALGW